MRPDFDASAGTSSVLVAVAASASAATPTSISTITSTAAPSPASAAFGFRPRFVDVQGAPTGLGTVERGDRLISILVAGHFHEAKAAGAPGIAVRHDTDTVDLPICLEHLAKLVFGGAEAQIAYKNILHSSASALSCRSASSVRRTGRSEGPS